MKKKDPNYIVKLEKAISKKYGQEAIENPRKHWTDEDEERHEEQTGNGTNAREKRIPESAIRSIRGVASRLASLP